MSKNDDPVYVICTECGKRCVLGENATGKRKKKAICDTCAGVIRDADGYAWFPGEQTMTLADPNTLEVVEVRQRPQ